MPIKSYLAYPQDGKYQQMISKLSEIEECDIISSKNKEVVVIITDTKDDIHDRDIEIKINDIKSLKMLSMVSGFETDQL